MGSTSREYFGLFGISNNSLDQVHKMRFQSRLFQLQDGTLVLDGFSKFVWTGQEIKHEDIQVLPRFCRICAPPAKLKIIQRVLWWIYRKLRRYFFEDWPC